ncbi:MAG: substrate-binding domain-containing protein [Eubacterium sp.]
MKKRKNLITKVAAVAAMAVLSMTALAGCGSNKNTAITVISREEGSGTRSAFTELMGITVDDVDNTVTSAEITSSTSVMLTSVEGNENAIGYISLGSLNDTVKAVKVDGVEASVDDIKNGSYSISRPFNIVTKSNISELAQDFINYILSDEGQAVINSEGYISVASGNSYQQSSMSGTITIAGSTSVAPVMEVLAEEYMAVNPDVTIEIQQSGSSAGITSTIEGACEIGMASRELEDTETAEGVSSTKIAMDGIAVIVNNNNETDSLSSEQIQKIFTGEITDWSEID